MSRLLPLLAIPLLLAACGDISLVEQEEREGDDPGECADDADNDADGLFDCADPDCAGAAVCADDDDAGPDDDDSSSLPDDDDVQPDDDDVQPDDDDILPDDDDSSGADDDDSSPLDDDDSSSADDDDSSPLPTLDEAADWSVQGDQAGANLGYEVAGAGDVNGDGYDDVLIGAHGYTNGQQYEGRAYLWLGSSTGLASSADWTVEGDQDGAALGNSVAGAGDVNGDGFDDLVIAVYGWDGPLSNEGRALVYLGSASGPDAAPAWSAEGDQAEARFGVSVDGAGDVNGDGYDDVLVGAHTWDGGQTNEGAVFLYLGSSAGPGVAAAWMAEGDTDDLKLGSSLAGAGDVDGDGFADVIVGAPFYEDTLALEGGAFVYTGSASGLSAAPAWTASGGQATAMFGVRVEAAGDPNGDGYADVVVGSHVWDGPAGTDTGAAFVFAGSATGLGLTSAATVVGDQAGANLGRAVGAAGDVDGDGWPDLLLGALHYDAGQTDEGRAYLHLGGAAGVDALPAWTTESDSAGALYGSSVGAAGDVDGDGYDDILVGAQFLSDPDSNEGGAWLFLGGVP